MTKLAFDPRALAESVAHAIFDDDGWDLLDDPTKAEYAQAAHRAIQAHDKWLLASGFKIVPPETIPAPKSLEEASAMLVAAKSWLDTHKQRKGFIMPPKPGMVN